MRDWLTIELVLAVLLVTSFTCVGLVALWAATSPRHWFVRTAVVLAILSPLMLIPAYEPLVVFLIQFIFVVAGVTVYRWHDGANGHGSHSATSRGAREVKALRFSTSTLLLLIVLCCCRAGRYSTAAIEHHRMDDGSAEWFGGRSGYHFRHLDGSSAATANRLASCTGNLPGSWHHRLGSRLVRSLDDFRLVRLATGSRSHRRDVWNARHGMANSGLALDSARSGIINRIDCFPLVCSIDDTFGMAMVGP